MNSDTATQIMSTHMKGEWRDRDRLNNPTTRDRVNDNGRTAQIEMINSHQPNMNEAALKTADWVLKQIGG